MKIKQGDATNEDFIKLVTKEVKIFKKHGGNFLWGQKQDDAYFQQLQSAKERYLLKHSKVMSAEEATEVAANTKKALQEEILAMAILKRSDKRRYGNRSCPR